MIWLDEDGIDVDVDDDDDDGVDDEYLQRSPSSGSESMWDITDDSLGDLDFAYYEVVVQPYITGAAMCTIQCIK